MKPKQIALDGSPVKAKHSYVVTAQRGTNSDIFPGILHLYVPEGSLIADVTYGKGIFWQQVDIARYRLMATDIETGVDLRALPYKNSTLDALILDPPYAHASKSPMKESISKTYGLKTLTGGRAQVRDLYTRGILEAKRTLRDQGILIVKCQDEVHGRKQHWNHIELIAFTEANGLQCEDLFVLVQTMTPTIRHSTQHHARKNHSYFLIFKKRRRKDV
jgi:hypothetical protein